VTRLTLLSLISALALTACSRESDLEERVKKLEAEVDRLAEVERFIRPFMEQQAAEQAQQDEREPDPDAVFAVDIEGNHYDGPADAAVTVVEAFDFA
jgi:Tfp pilus assembly protein PilP